MASFLRSVATIFTLAMLSGTATVACGGGSETESLEDYFGQLEAFNDTYSEKQDALDEEFADKLDVNEFSEEARDDFQSYFEQTRGAAAEFVEELEGLNPPGEASIAHNSTIEKFNDCLKETEGVGEAIGGAESFEDISTILDDSTGVCEETTQSCEDLQSLADENSVDVDLNCGE